MNKVVELGRLTKNPDIKYTPNGKAVAQFTLAVNRPFKNQQGEYDADFIPCVAWGKVAELIGNSCVKGNRLLVEGRLQIRNYEGKDGQKRYITEVIVENMEFIERKSDSNKQPTNMAQMGQEVPFEDVPFD